MGKYRRRCRRRHTHRLLLLLFTPRHHCRCALRLAAPVLCSLRIRGDDLHQRTVPVGVWPLAHSVMTNAQAPAELHPGRASMAPPCAHWLCQPHTFLKLPPNPVVPMSHAAHSRREELFLAEVSLCRRRPPRLTARSAATTPCALLSPVVASDEAKRRPARPVEQPYVGQTRVRLPDAVTCPPAWQGARGDRWPPGA